jgi:NAD(P)-dependent dehydrogenase (short-subunit alcohol dehydrogenase family)
MNRLHVKTVVVSGGSSSIGHAAALLFASEGAAVALLGPLPQRLAGHSPPVVRKPRACSPSDATSRIQARSSQPSSSVQQYAV